VADNGREFTPEDRKELCHITRQIIARKEIEEDNVRRHDKGLLNK
jgi:hypothetical protein